jgi:sterol desaturase/sphingolipid hydroxylase (fatty acid hydroxylase superfamily)
MPEHGYDTSILEVAFYGSLALFAAIEALWPRRKDRFSFTVRWGSNFSLLGLELLIAWVLVPGGLIALAAYAQAKGWGLLNAFGAEPAWLPALASILLYDLLKYWEHRLFHRSSWLWHIHVVHHADLDVDFTTTLRHHPFEVLLSLVIGAAAVVTLGLSPLGIFVYSVLAAVVTTMSHANVRWNTSLDRLLRMVLMTRDAHAVHHSTRRKETDSNYAVVFIWWDYLFGTYIAVPEQGLDRFDVGVEYFRSARDLTLPRILTMPFRLPKKAVPAAPSADADDRPESVA